MAKKQSSKKSSKKTAAKKGAARATAKKSMSKSRNKGGATLDKRTSTSLSTAAARKSSPATVSQQIDLKQSSEYMGNDWWKWSVWIDGPATVLKNIDSVTYTLHSTFADPVRHHTNAEEKFRLSSEGWGEFTITAEVKPKTGSKFTKRHWLTLEYPRSGTTAQARSGGSVSMKKEKAAGRPTVFLSAGISDLRMGNALAGALRQHSIDVLKADELSPDLPWDVEIAEMIKKADLMVVLLSGQPSIWTTREIYAAKERALQIVPVLMGPDARLPDDIEEFQAIKVKDTDADANAPYIAAQIIDRTKSLLAKP